MDAGILYCNAKIKSREQALLTKDKLLRLADASSLAEALKMLAEAGYAMGANDEEILRSEEKNSIEFVRSILPKGYGIETIFMQNDYHNAKCFAKKRFFKADVEHSIKANGLLEIEDIDEAIKNDDYKHLPSEMKSSFEKLLKMFEDGKLVPSAIDIEFDKAMFLAINKKLKDSDKLMKKFFALLADLTNFAIVIRGTQKGFTDKQVENMLVTGGDLSPVRIMCAYGAGIDEIIEKFRYIGDYKEAIKVYKEGDAEAEVYRDNLLLNLIKKQKYDMFSPAICVGYYLGKQREITNVRLILSAIKNGVDRKLIKARFRELYV